MWSVKNFKKGFMTDALVGTFLSVALITFPKISLKEGVDLGPIVSLGNMLAYLMMGFILLLLVLQGLPKETTPDQEAQE